LMINEATKDDKDKAVCLQRCRHRGIRM
jgi:hypothetical protein